jgi:hypothetical protein
MPEYGTASPAANNRGSAAALSKYDDNPTGTDPLLTTSASG